MAAMLIEIKSRMLLPPQEDGRRRGSRRPARRTGAPAARIRADEAGRGPLDALPLLGRDFLRAQVSIEQSLEPRFPDVNLDDLRGAWRDILRRARLTQHHHITREQLSVREHMSIVLERLQGRRFVEFQELFDPAARHAGAGGHLPRDAGAVKESLIELTQAEAFAPIYVRLAYQPA